MNKAEIIIDKDEIRLNIEYNASFLEKLKFIKEKKWDSKNKQWIFPGKDEVLRKLKEIIKSCNILINNNNETENCFIELKKELIYRNYSPKTVISYIYNNREFLKYLKKSPGEVCREDVMNYCNYLKEVLKYSNSTINKVVHSIKFLFGEVLNRYDIIDMKNPKIECKLPDVLTIQEVKRIIDKINNIKHKCMIALTYSSGLRVSETSNLLLKDIDFERKMIHIRRAKGNKDRYTILSRLVSILLTKYLQIHQPHNWLFESWTNDRHISVRSIQKIFEKAKKEAGITKVVSIHSLRHSFATHLIEAGTDIRYVQSLLGHKDIKATEIYTHISNNKLSNIKSPFDLM